MVSLPSWLGGSSDDSDSGSAGNAQQQDPFGGLLRLYTNPQSAGLMGLASGLLQAAGPSRIPVTMGQAMGAGLNGMQAGVGNAVQAQRQMLQMQAMQGLMGGGQPQGAPQGHSSQSNGSAGLFGGSAGMGMPGAPNAAGPSAAPNAAPAQAGPLIMGRTPQQLWNQGMLMNMAGMQGGAEMMQEALKYDPTLAAQMPTDITKMGTQAGMTPDQIKAANAGGIAKANYIAPTSGRPGGYLKDPTTGQLTWLPNVPQGATPQFDSNGQFTGVAPMAGAAQVAQQQAAATAGGKAQFAIQQVWDPTANSGQGGFVNQTVSNVANAANGNGGSSSQVPVGIRNNNFGNIKGSNGQFATYSTPQEGVNAADQTLAAYGNKYGINSLTGIANRWAPKGDGDNNPTAKAAAMATSLGVGVNDPINLSDPAVRAKVLPALFDTETPGWRNAIGGGAAPAGAGNGPMASQPPMGVANAANASQSAPSKQMADAYNGLSTADANYQQSREALNDMIGLAQNKGAGGTAIGLLPSSVGTKISQDAATYQKAHATYVALQGKALGSGGTDASRETINESVPTYDKPQAAMITGLNNQLNNLDLGHLKTQFLTPLYQAGNEKTYTQQSAAFDQNIKPSMMPVLNLTGPQQQAAVQAAVKANPAMRASYEWAFNNGLLK